MLFLWTAVIVLNGCKILYFVSSNIDTTGRPAYTLSSHFHQQTVRVPFLRLCHTRTATADTRRGGAAATGHVHYIPTCYGWRSSNYKSALKPWSCSHGRYAGESDSSMTGLQALCCLSTSKIGFRLWIWTVNSFICFLYNIAVNQIFFTIT